MNLPVNTFKRGLGEPRPQIGLWLAFADAYVAEALSTADYDWLLLDGEHAPNDLRNVLEQLQAIAAYQTHPIVRPVNSDPALIKQYLDIGVQTLLVPMVDSGEQARAIVQATQYPPKGIRGVGSSLARASRWNAIGDYLHRAQDELCVLVQVESQAGMAELDAIAQTDGVDGVFFGPADLSASLGFLGQPNHPDVRAMIEDGIRRVRALGKAAGVLATDQAVAHAYIECGANFVGVGVDTTLLVRSAKALRAQFAGASATDTNSAGSAY